MAGLGVRVYLDENVDIHVTDALQRHGYEATHALREGNMRVCDEQHLRYATLHGRAVVTHNFGDYVRLHADFVQRGEHHEGIILVPVVIGRRKAFPNAAAGGKAVTEHIPKDTKATEELQALLKAIYIAD